LEFFPFFELALGRAPGTGFFSLLPFLVFGASSSSSATKANPVPEADAAERRISALASALKSAEAASAGRTLKQLSSALRTGIAELLPYWGDNPRTRGNTKR
jgi:hypothetical protein